MRPQQVDFLSRNFRRFIRLDRSEQSFHAIEDAVSIVEIEVGLMRPSVAVLAQLADQASLSVVEPIAEDAVPLVPHYRQQRVSVPASVGNELSLTSVVAKALLRARRATAGDRRSRAAVRRTEPSPSTMRPMRE